MRPLGIESEQASFTLLGISVSQQFGLRRCDADPIVSQWRMNPALEARPRSVSRPSRGMLPPDRLTAMHPRESLRQIDPTG